MSAATDMGREAERVVAGTLSARLFAWIGGYRDDLPPTAVIALQVIGDEVGDLERALARYRRTSTPAAPGLGDDRGEGL